MIKATLQLMDLRFHMLPSIQAGKGFVLASLGTPSVPSSQ